MITDDLSPAIMPVSSRSPVVLSADSASTSSPDLEMRSLSVSPRPLSAVYNVQTASRTDQSSTLVMDVDHVVHVAPPDHWSRKVHETIVSTGRDGLLHLPVLGGAEVGQFCWIGGRGSSDGKNCVSGADLSLVNCHSGKLFGNEILLEVHGEQVAGYTLNDLLRLLWAVTDNGQPIMLKTVDADLLTKDLRHFLSRRFEKDSVDHVLQKIVRNNIYKKCLPCTTRPPRPGEIDGLHYRFLSVDEFQQLERSGGLLEAGVFDGNYYGTPVPPKDQHSNYTTKPDRLKPTGITSGRDRSIDVERPTNATSSVAVNGTNGSNRCVSVEKERTSQPLAPPTVGQQNDLDSVELPKGWEKVVDPVYGVYYIDHNNKRTQYENPLTSKSDGGAFKTKLRLVGDFIHAELTKSSTGLGFTIVGCEDPSNDILLQIKTVLPDGPAFQDGRLRSGDVLVRVNNQNIVGFTHADVAELFRAIPIGHRVDIDVCRGNYPLPFDPNDPRTEVITTVAVAPLSNKTNNLSQSGPKTDAQVDKPARTPTAPLATFFRHFRSRSHDDQGNLSGSCDVAIAGNRAGKTQTITVVPRPEAGGGFGFKISDLTPEIRRLRAKNSDRGRVKGQSQTTAETASFQPVVISEVFEPSYCGELQKGDILLEVGKVDVSKMGLVDVTDVLRRCQPEVPVSITFYRPATTTAMSDTDEASNDNSTAGVLAPGTSSIPPATSAIVTSQAATCRSIGSRDSKAAAASYGFPPCSSLSGTPDFIPASAYKSQPNASAEVAAVTHRGGSPNVSVTNGFLLQRGCGDQLLMQQATGGTQRSEVGSFDCPLGVGLLPAVERVVFLRRRDVGFGFRIVGGIEEGTQVSVGHLVPGGAADIEGRLKVGDMITSIDGHSVLGASHHQVVQLISEAASHRGHVTLGVCSPYTPGGEWHKNYPERRSGVEQAYDGMSDGHVTVHDVTLMRGSDEGYGFVIVSSLVKPGSFVGRLTEGGPAERSRTLHVGDRLLAVNGIDVVEMPHHDVVQLIRSNAADRSLVLTVATIHSNGGGSTTAAAAVASSLSPASSSCSTSSHRLDPDADWNGSGGTDSHANVVLRQPHTGCDGPEAMTELIELTRGSRGFGFSIRGGVEFGDLPLCVLKIAEGGAASVDGRLKVNDELVEINGLSTHRMTHFAALEMIQNGGQRIRLLIRRYPAADGDNQSSSSSVNMHTSNSSTPIPEVALFCQTDSNDAVQSMYSQRRDRSEPRDLGSTMTPSLATARPVSMADVPSGSVSQGAITRTAGIKSKSPSPQATASSAARTAAPAQSSAPSGDVGQLSTTKTDIAASKSLLLLSSIKNRSGSLV